jgi:ribosomal protection tetracycline resistance protein
VSTLNLGILAHVDAGKTSLTERLLYAAGVIGAAGSVDAGSTQTDSLALERQRGITIRSAVVSFTVGDVCVNLIDTPGHPDFIAEVERALAVLDGAVLVISAVEGVQAQTRVLMRALQRLRLPTLLFVNKIDRSGARDEGVLAEIAAKLTPAAVAMGSVSAPGTRDARFAAHGAGDPAFRSRLAEVLADRDDQILAAWLGGAAVPYRQLEDGLAAQCRRGLVHPVFFGSAMTGAGLGPLTAGITGLLPTAAGDPDGPVSGTVFKVERGPAGEKIAYARLFSGTVRARDRVPFGQDGSGKVTAVSAFGSAAGSGQIAKLWGLDGIQVGDAVGRPPSGGARHQFAPPTLQTVVVPTQPGQGGALHTALTQLAEQDPLINLHRDDLRQELALSLYGEVQKEVIGATLAAEYGIEAEFRGTTAICIERVTGMAEAAEVIGGPGNPFPATVGLRIEPSAAGSGITYQLAVELGSLPLSFHKAVRETALETLREGLSGWQVTDAVVTMTAAGFAPPATTAGDFRALTPLVLMTALRQAGTSVLEPVQHIRLEAPPDTGGAVAASVARLGGVPQAPVQRGPSCLLTGEIPSARLHELQQQLPGLTRGEGVLECVAASYRAARRPVPIRPRTDHNPLNRAEYLLHVVRRV